LGARARREVERDHGLVAKLLPHSAARQVDARGVVGEAARGQLVLIGAEQQRQVRARFAALAESIKRYRVEAQLFKGAGEGARKSGEAGHGPEVAQPAGADRLFGDARGQRFADDAPDGHERAAIQLGGGKFQDELAECQPVHADQRVAAGCKGDFAGGLAHRRHHQHRTPLYPLGDELRRTRTQLGIAVHGAEIPRLTPMLFSQMRLRGRQTKASVPRAWWGRRFRLPTDVFTAPKGAYPGAVFPHRLPAATRSAWSSSDCSRARSYTS